MKVPIKDAIHVLLAQNPYKIKLTEICIENIDVEKLLTLIERVKL